MANFQQTLNEEIRRLARKETSGAIKEIRAQLVELRKSHAELNRRLKALEKALPAPPAKPAAEASLPEAAEERKNPRVTPERIIKWRTATGLNKSQFAALLGVNPLSLIRWESGKSAPRTEMKRRIAAVHAMGKRELAKLMAEKNIAVKKAKAK